MIIMKFRSCFLTINKLLVVTMTKTMMMIKVVLVMMILEESENYGVVGLNFI